ncbi:MAG: hypothetical protein IPO67_22495 [Deltaproteobacteria bacterium]|nr:hypothetical protein [Deltaproteobacteria bacterium]
MSIAEALLAAASPAWRAALSRPAGPEKDAESTLTRHLRRYTKQNTADFFIHKNLGRFLRRELDFFIKNELFDLDHIDTVSEDTLRKRVVKVRALRRLAVKLIDWLHQLEEFQRRLFLKKKFVLRTDWAITLDRVPRALWPEIAQNKAQVRRWRDLFKIDALAPDLFSDGGGEADTVTVEFLEQNMGLVVETGLFDRGFVFKILSALLAMKCSQSRIFGEAKPKALRRFPAGLSRLYSMRSTLIRHTYGGDGLSIATHTSTPSWRWMMLRPPRGIERSFQVGRRNCVSRLMMPRCTISRSFLRTFVS